MKGLVFDLRILPRVVVLAPEATRRHARVALALDRREGARPRARGALVRARAPGRRRARARGDPQARALPARVARSGARSRRASSASSRAWLSISGAMNVGLPALASARSPDRRALGRAARRHLVHRPARGDAPARVAHVARAAAHRRGARRAHGGARRRDRRRRGRRPARGLHRRARRSDAALARPARCTTRSAPSRTRSSRSSRKSARGAAPEFDERELAELLESVW